MEKKRLCVVVLDPERGKVAFVLPENLFFWVELPGFG